MSGGQDYYADLIETSGTMPTHEPICCTPKRLPEHQRIEAAQTAISINPRNRPRIERMVQGGVAPTAMRIAVMTQKFWHGGKVSLSVGFMSAISQSLADKLLGHMNAWSKTANVEFHYGASARGSQVRIAFGPSGYWSYLGTDILSIAVNQPTMNLQGFNGPMPDSEYFRVVRHETGHTLGCPHEHSRPEIVALLDPAKTTAFFERNQGWSAQEIQDQILTPIPESSLNATPHADQTSIMAYQFPGACTKSGLPIIGGTDINALDAAFMGSIYPLAITPPPPPPPPPPVNPPTGVVATLPPSTTGYTITSTNH